jgi:hypothetical protein
MFGGDPVDEHVVRMGDQFPGARNPSGAVQMGMVCEWHYCGLQTIQQAAGGLGIFFGDVADDVRQVCSGAVSPDDRPRQPWF